MIPDSELNRRSFLFSALYQAFEADKQGRGVDRHDGNRDGKRPPDPADRLEGHNSRRRQEQYNIDTKARQAKLKRNDARHVDHPHGQNGCVCRHGGDRGTECTARRDQQKVEHDVKHRSHHCGQERVHTLFAHHIHGGKEGNDRLKCRRAKQGRHIPPRVKIRGIEKQSRKKSRQEDQSR